jgi:nicotinate-nucleotide pyrophosphorylase (carboxylating)
LKPSQSEISEIVDAALREDIGFGDVTTQATVEDSRLATGRLLAKAPGVICGIDIAAEAFLQVDSRIEFIPELSDGAKVTGSKETIARIIGPAAGILTAERVALNFIQRLSGVATIASRYVDAVSGTNARIIDTRKTTPGLRIFEKWAVRVGGAHNHRVGLSDGVLIKDNHIIAAGGISEAVKRARLYVHHLIKIEVEVKDIAQIAEALEAGADAILLDNMNAEQLREAVSIIGGNALTEASGGINLNTVAEIAKSGVDLISVGALTHSAPALDISLDFDLQ